MHGEGDGGAREAAHGSAVVGGSAALQKAWCNAEHCLPLDDVVRREVWDGMCVCVCVCVFACVCGVCVCLFHVADTGSVTNTAVACMMT